MTPCALLVAEPSGYRVLEPKKNVTPVLGGRPVAVTVVVPPSSAMGGLARR